MVGEVFEHGEGGGRLVRVGDGPEDTYAPLKLYQQIYRQVTGRQESITKEYQNNLLMDFSAIEQLHYKMTQLCQVHHVVGWNEVVSVFHEKDRKEQFNSFEAFQRYNANTSSACIAVVLKFYFSVVPPTGDRPQEYEVEIRLSSRVAAIQQMKEDPPPFMSGGYFFSFLAAEVALIKVTYSDYVVARGFMEAFDEWVNGCKAVPKLRWLRWAQRWSEALRWVGGVLGAILVALSALDSIKVLGAHASAQSWARFFVVYILSLFLGVVFFSGAGRLLENGIDRYSELSYLKLNKGDEKLIDEFSHHNRGAVIRFVGGCLLTIALGVISSRIDSFMSN